MMKRCVAAPVLLLIAACAAACDKPADAPADAATTAPSAVPSAAPSASAAPLASASAAPSASASAAPAAAVSDVTVTVRDPATDSTKTVKALVGGSVTVYLPEYPGTTWTGGDSDRGLGKPKEEMIPGFLPGTPGHQLTWSTKSPMLKKGQSHKIQLVNKKAGKPTGTTFTLNIDLE